MTDFVQESKFPLGQLTVTSRVNNRIADDTDFAKFVLVSLRRHAVCDWGEICESDKQLNNTSLETGDRLVSAYDSPVLPKIWIITEADHSVTTVLFPDEY